MTTTWQDLAKEARDLVIAGNLDEAEKKTAQAKAIKGLDALETPAPANTAARLPFETKSADDVPPSMDQVYAGAVKSVYVKKYGTIEASTEQVLRELYGDTGLSQTKDYYMLRAAKYADMTRYCRSNIADPMLSRLLLYTPDQVMKGIAADVPVEGRHSLKATMIEGNDQLGGYVVPEDYRLEIVQRLPGLTIVRPLAQKFNTNRDRVSFLVRRGGNKRYIGNIRSAQTDESPSSSSLSETNALFGEIEIPVHVNLANVPISKSMFEDSGLDLMNEVLMPEFTSQAALKEDEQFLVGSGVKEPQGLLNGQTGAPFNQDVSIYNSGAAANITFDAVVKSPFSLAGQYRMRKSASVGYAFNSTTAQTLAGLKNSVGEYLWREMYGNNAVGVPDTLRGWNVFESEALPLEAANSFPIIFGDWQGYRIVDRIGMSIQRYDDALTASTDSLIFYLRRRYGGQVAEGYRFVAIKCSTASN